jgi:hypothetical protein
MVAGASTLYWLFCCSLKFFEKLLCNRANAILFLSPNIYPWPQLAAKFALDLCVQFSE